jgi:hypothetical protein
MTPRAIVGSSGLPKGFPGRRVGFLKDVRVILVEAGLDFHDCGGEP